MGGGTNVQQLTCKIDLSSSFYFCLFFSFVLLELKPFLWKVLGEKILKKCQKVWKIMKRFLPFSCCPLFSFSLKEPQVYDPSGPLTVFDVAFRCGKTRPGPHHAHLESLQHLDSNLRLFLDSFWDWLQRCILVYAWNGCHLSNWRSHLETVHFLGPKWVYFQPFRTTFSMIVAQILVFIVISPFPILTL